MSKTTSTTTASPPASPVGKVTLWELLTTVRTNPINLKCQTLPIFSLRSQYSRNFHLSWLGFWVAFLSWFAFSPLIPEAVKEDLKLTPAQIGNSNIVSLCATLIVRLIVGPMVDRYGPRKVMGTLLVIGAIPSGLAGTVKSASGLYTVRFFIGILGGTFVPCQAWTTAFFDKNVVGSANALVGGWGNSGGGFTFLIMVSLYNQLRSDGLSSHSAWRAAFAIVPVPVLLFTAFLVFTFGTDHPAGKWSDRHNIPAAHMASVAHGQEGTENLEGDDEKLRKAREYDEKHYNTDSQKDGTSVTVAAADVGTGTGTGTGDGVPKSSLDTAVNEPLTLKSAGLVLGNRLTWLPALAYLTTFGYELAIDANLANVMFNLYKSPSFTQTSAGYYAGIFGLINIVTRPTGGYLGDQIYKRYGVPGKKYLTIALGFSQGVVSVGLGVYIDSMSHPRLGAVVALYTIMGVFNEAANGANFALVPHCNPNSNGLMSGIVGASGNLGGIFFAMVFRFVPRPIGRAFWISGIMAMAVNTAIVTIRVPAW